jgi:hypothetical protein
LLKQASFKHAARLFAGNTQGGVILAFALGLPVLSILAAGAVELAEVANAKSKLQAIVDAAALKGAGELASDQTTATTERTRVFADWKASEVGMRWTITSSVVADAPRGRMTVGLSAVRPSFFGSLLPPGGFRLAASAAARNQNETPLCVLATHGAGAQVLTLAGNANLKAATCLVQSNRDVAAANNSRIEAGKVQAATAASGTISPAPVTDVPVRVDPFAALPISVPATCTTNFDVIINSGTYPVSPGVHCGKVDISGSAVLQLSPGDYYFVGSSVTIRGNAQVSGTDAALIFKGQTTVDFSGNATVSLEGRRSGTYAGFVVVGDRSFTGTMTFSTPYARKLHGTIYLPNGDLAVSGYNTRVADLSSWTIVVTRKLDVSGTAALTINSDYLSGSVPVPAGAGSKTNSETTTRLEN